VKGGRCSECGALTDVASIARRERVGERMDRYLGDPLDWLELVPVLVLGGLVVASVIPAWTLLIALVFAVRPLWRLLIRIVAGWGDGPQGLAPASNASRKRNRRRPGRDLREVAQWLEVVGGVLRRHHVKDGHGGRRRRRRELGGGSRRGCCRRDRRGGRYRRRRGRAGGPRHRRRRVRGRDLRPPVDANKGPVGGRRGQRGTHPGAIVADCTTGARAAPVRQIQTATPRPSSARAALPALHECPTRVLGLPTTCRGNHTRSGVRT
jgi:hypothetical protein